MSYGVGRKRGSDPELLWLWLWPAAVAPIRPLAWEPPYATGVALKKTPKKAIFILNTFNLFNKNIPVTF